MWKTNTCNFITAYIYSGQFNGCSILYPDFKSSNRSSKGTPGYGDPPSEIKPNLLSNGKFSKQVSEQVLFNWLGNMLKYQGNFYPFKPKGIFSLLVNKCYNVYPSRFVVLLIIVRSAFTRGNHMKERFKIDLNLPKVTISHTRIPKAHLDE